MWIKFLNKNSNIKRLWVHPLLLEMIWNIDLLRENPVKQSKESFGNKYQRGHNSLFYPKDKHREKFYFLYACFRTGEGITSGMCMNICIWTKKWSQTVDKNIKSDLMIDLTARITLLIKFYFPKIKWGNFLKIKCKNKFSTCNIFSVLLEVRASRKVWGPPLYIDPDPTLPMWLHISFGKPDSHSLSWAKCHSIYYP